MTYHFDSVDELAVTTIRTLSMDAVQQANSGHPGAPMGLAPVAHVLFARFLKHSPANPTWPDRDRFVLSCGHASMLIYSLLHLFGYDLGLEEIKEFRQWGSRTPGHPEWNLTPGVEFTSGPLGQGCSASVGMALAEAHLAARFNTADHEVVDHRTWVLCSDGDLMEGVASEAASIAGHLGLAKLVWIWDDNRITIEGDTDLAFSEDVRARFRAYGWRVLEVDDVNDLSAVAAALDEATTPSDGPTLIAARSHIAWGAPTKQDTAAAHGAPLGDDEVRATKRAYGWPAEESFVVPAEVLERCNAVERGLMAEAEWARRIALWQRAHPERAAELARRLEGRLPTGWDGAFPHRTPADDPVATRAASGTVLNAIAEALPELVGGSADLAPSTKTLIASSGDVSAAAHGERNLRFGIREHGMAAILNGLCLHGGVRPYGATFLVFADYMRPSIRLAALMEQPVIYVFTHDSIWVGEDGPTHQPVEHLASLRAVPGLTVIRPADFNETSAAWRVAVERREGPTALVLSRQKLPTLEGTVKLAVAGVQQGGYVLSDGGDDPAAVLVATGSEVGVAVRAAAVMTDRGVATRVVSMPSWELFRAQPARYREEVLPDGVPRFAVEAGVAQGWHEWVGPDGAVFGIDGFGASAPGAEVAERYGFTGEAVAERALRHLKREPRTPNREP
jgi:transketolase